MRRRRRWRHGRGPRKPRAAGLCSIRPARRRGAPPGLSDAGPSGMRPPCSASARLLISRRDEEGAIMRILIALAAATLASAATAANAPQTSWGKAGVSYDDYRSDATFCLRQAAGADLTGTAPANALVLASRRMATGQTNDYSPTVGGAGSTGPATTNSGFDPMIEAANRMQQGREDRK